VFPGFPNETMTFFRGLTRHNEREWFQQRKEIFETQVKAPMVSLVEAINAEFAKFAPEYINDSKRAIYRIYRDTRFSADKTPYKTHLAAVFPRRGGTKDSSPGFYFQVSAKGVGVASGLYQPAPEYLLAVRTWLADHHAEFRKAAKGPEKLMGKLHGSTLQRIPKGFAQDHPASELIKMKQWLYWVELDAKLVTSPKLFAELVKRFRATLPVLELLNKPLTQVRPRPSALSAADLF
jgi:uncharacterized protein (TIGR02453 family)